MWRCGLCGDRSFDRGIRAPATNGDHLTNRSASQPMQRRDRSGNAGKNGPLLRRIANVTIPMALRQAPNAPARFARNCVGVSVLGALAPSRCARRSRGPKHVRGATSRSADIRKGVGYSGTLSSAARSRGRNRWMTMNHHSRGCPSRPTSASDRGARHSWCGSCCQTVPIR